MSGSIGHVLFILDLAEDGDSSDRGSKGFEKFFLCERPVYSNIDYANPGSSLCQCAGDSGIFFATLGKCGENS